MSLGSALIILAALGVVALDVSILSPWTGLPVILGMALVVLAVAEQIRQFVAARRAEGGLAALLWFEGSLLLALLGFLVARVLVLVRAFEGGASGPQLAAAQTYDLVFTVLAGLAGALVLAPERTGRGLLAMAQRPATALLGGFAGMIGVGSLLLTLPISLSEAGHVSFVDALFTMASAVCVTGLTVNDVATTYSLFGQAVILVGVQLGGIGIMTIPALALAFGRDASLRNQLRYAAMLDARTLSDLRRLVLRIVAGTLVIEGLGALLLWSMLAGDPRTGEFSAGWSALFHAVTAFCHAGISLFPGGLSAFAGDFGVQVVVMALVMLGGLGFPVIAELTRHGWLRLRRRLSPSRPAPPRLSLATRVAATMMVALTLVGALVIFALEFTRSLAPAAEHGLGYRLLAALFAAVNTRSSGFNTVDLGSMQDATLLVMAVLMFIGGSPASTAGGIKTTTLAVVGAAMRGELRGREPELGGRALAPEVLRKATAVLVMMAGLVLLFTLLLTLTERQSFMPLFFEVVSALATVGLSTGITGSLTTTGKLLLSLGMFVGRVGPFTIALAVGQDQEARTHQRYRLAREELQIM